MCGRLRVGKENLHVAGLVGAAMCPASHDGFSVKGREEQQNVIQGGALIPAGFPAKPHIRWELIPSHCPAFGTGELQENGTTLCRRRRSATPNNGDVPSDHRLLGTRSASRIGTDQVAGFKTAPWATTIIACITWLLRIVGPQQHPHPWRSCAGGGAVHSINSGPSELGRRNV